MSPVLVVLADEAQLTDGFGKPTVLKTACNVTLLPTPAVQELLELLFNDSPSQSCVSATKAVLTASVD